MAILAANATRMELLRLKRRLAVARRGHKLLKDKMDELVRQFLALVHAYERARRDVERRLAEAYRAFLGARSVADLKELETAMVLPSRRPVLHGTIVPVMNLRLPEFTLDFEGEKRCYGGTTAPGELDDAVAAFTDVLPDMIRLAEMENKAEKLADEIETTRRRVNALEYVLIPDLGDTIKFIRQKLAEMERGNLSRLMRVKEIVRKRA